MIDRIELPATSERTEIWLALYPQIESLVKHETDLIAAMANVCAALHQAFAWHWIGFYRVVGNELVLGPFQGPIACTRIARGKGVCGSAWEQNKTLIVADVDQFPGHIACSAMSRSEVVVPYHDRSGIVRGVLDIDSTELNGFTPDDASFLERICELMRQCD
ncbi:MAG: GAF domain-containing protein [Bacteroidota bacterium]|nr:GAF domain-containing protein [Bacteroidota bacterium]